jgi:hypothetical protein
LQALLFAGGDRSGDGLVDQDSALTVEGGPVDLFGDFFREVPTGRIARFA